jgi:hypothetical protein
MMETPDPTTMKIIGGTIAALSTAIGVQWKTTLSHLHRVEGKLDECEDDRNRLWQTIATQCGKDVTELRGKGK